MTENNFNTMSDKLKKAGALLATAASVASLHSYIINLQDNTMKKLVETYRLEQEALGKTIVKLAEDNTISEARKINFLKNTESEISRLQKIVDNLKQGENKTAVELINEKNVDWSRDANESLAELHKLVNDYKGSGSGSSSQLVDRFNINLVEELQEAMNSYLTWFNNLPLTHQGAVTHILISITILLCLSSLITVFYSDYLIKRFSVETRYPRLAKYINLRRTFQQYYFLLNTVVIVLFLFAIIALNTYILMNS